MVNVNRLRYHYEHVLRQDLLLKLNYSNIMEASQLSQIIIVSQVPYEAVKHVSLALEIICGQKTVQTESSILRTSKVFKYLALRSKKGSKQPNYLVRASLRAEIMYNFIEKLVTVICFHDYTMNIEANVIQLTIGSNLLRLFPEIQNHFELFESLQSVQVMIITSAKTKEETRLIWTGLLQKEV